MRHIDGPKIRMQLKKGSAYALNSEKVMVEVSKQA
jgi:hypothetical protein